MGPSAVDLPDPLNNPEPPPLALQGADDLLSQLVGDQIDRLMRDDRPTPVLDLRAPAGEPTPSTLEPKPAHPPAEAQIVEEPQPPQPAEVFESEEAFESTEVFESEEVFDGPIDHSAAPPAHPASGALEEVESDLARELAADERLGDRIDAASIEQATENIRSQLDELLAEVDLTPVPFMRPPEKPPAAPAPAPAHAIPMYLAPLVWANAPVTLLPAWARKLLGAVSVFLFVVALGAMGYVMFLRYSVQL
jgi:hypothetical protein